MYLEITFKNMAAYAGDIGDRTGEFEAVTEKVICSSAGGATTHIASGEI